MGRFGAPISTLYVIMTKKQIKNQIKVLKETIQWFKKQVEPHDCGWMHTTIDGL